MIGADDRLTAWLDDPRSRFPWLKKYFVYEPTLLLQLRWLD